jgi:SAM-dependent methyltransferase
MSGYDLDYYKIINRDESNQALVLQQNIIRIFNPKRVIDFGCGTGLYLTEFKGLKLGIDISIDAFGDEVRMIGRQFLMEVDITTHINIPKFDLGICIEVLEHIDEKYSDRVIENMVKASNTWIVTAAQPGQAGLNHVNCQPQGYWDSKFSKHGYNRDYINEVGLIYPVSLVPHQFWIIRNLMIYKR